MNAIDQHVAPTKRKRIALFSSDPAFRDDTAKRLEALAIYDVRIGNVEDILTDDLSKINPTLIILDVADGKIVEDERFIELRDKWGEVPIIALSEELSPKRMRNLVRINAADWLSKPVKSNELLNAVTFHDSGNRSSKSRITTVMGASGGAGGTMVSLAAAHHLAGKSDDAAAETCLVDLDFQSADCGGYLNLSSEFDLDGVISDPDRLDVELMDVIKLTRDPGFTIYSFERPGLPYEPTGSDFVLRLLDLVAYRFDQIVVDLPNRETPWSEAVIRASDQIVIVFELNIASLRHAKRLFRRIRDIRGNAASITLVANKHKRKLFGNHFSRRELQKIFKQKKIRSVAFDRDLLTDALNRALLPDEINARARYNKDLAAIFKDCLDDKKK